MLIGASLKMYFGHAQTVDWVREVAGIVAQHPGGAGVEAFVIPQFPSIPASLAVSGPLLVGAQDVATAENGAFTGEVAAGVLAELGCRYVEVGHAERRRLFGETDEAVALKVRAALSNGLTPLICIGEAERVSADQAAALVIDQIDAALAVAHAEGLNGPIVIAYEPLWAIGAPAPAGTEHIAAVCAAIRAHLVGKRARVIYGGSAGPGLLSELAGSVDGLFLGRFAHDPAAFREILNEAAALCA